MSESDDARPRGEDDQRSVALEVSRLGQSTEIVELSEGDEIASDGPIAIRLATNSGGDDV